MGVDDGPEPAELTYADVLNGITRGGRPPPRPPDPQPLPYVSGRPLPPPADTPSEEVASAVRAYAWTAGRTRSSWQFEIETLVSTTARAEDRLDTLRSEHQVVARLCRRSMSVAEIGALMSLPIGVVRVLLDDMAGLGLIDVHRTPTGPGDRPGLELLDRVRRGLTNLRG
ncbi:DUF742 domain-containing protein [Actinophytocola sp.]|jgi:hypothetical protein|uniref:DUF742 domain-containing protein n=1 Tax=Actinophytocola sp. TaxID=1872138 RepID=UPI002ED7864C